MGNILVSLVIFLILGTSTAIIISEKKKGVKCIGCPYAGKKNTGNITTINIK